MILLVDPGSNTSDTARLRTSACAASAGRLGSKVGTVASARICPVRGSMTTTVPLSARRLLDLLRDRLLGDPLHVAVDGELHARAGDGVGPGRRRRSGSRCPAPSSGRPACPRCRRARLSKPYSRPEPPRAVGAHVADDVRRDLAGGVDARRGRLAEDAGEPEGRHLRPHVGRDALGQVDEAARPGHALRVRRRVAARARWRAARPRPSTSVTSVWSTVTLRAATVVASGTPLTSVMSPRTAGSTTVRVRSLSAGRRQRRPLHGLQVDDARGDDGEHDEQPDLPDPQPTAGVAEARAPRRPGRRRRCTVDAPRADAVRRARGGPARRRRERRHGRGLAVGASGTASSDMRAAGGRVGTASSEVLVVVDALAGSCSSGRARAVGVAVAASAVAGVVDAAAPPDALRAARLGRRGVTEHGGSRRAAGTPAPARGPCRGRRPVAAATRAPRPAATFCSSRCSLHREVALHVWSASRSRTRPAPAWC